MKLLPRRGSPRRKAWIRRYIIAGVFLGIAGLCYLAAPIAKKVYNESKKDRALEQAENFLAEQDFPNAKLALDVALSAKPGDPETLKVAADLLEQVGAPQVMPLRRRLVQANPESVENHADLVMSALRFNDLNAARDAMRNMTPEQANEPPALRAALAYAQATNNLPIADALYDRLRAVEPDNENLQVLHAILRLNNPQPDVRSAALAELNELKAQPRHALFILRRLLIDAMARQETERSTDLAIELTSTEGAVLTDHLHRANLDLNVNKQPFESVLAQVLPHVSNSTADAAELLRWLILVGEADRAQSWLAQQSEDIKSSPDVLVVRAELAVAQSAWDRLGDLLESSAWGPVQRDTVRLAFSARLAAERGNENLKEQIWEESLVSASTSLAELNLLYRLASTWRWDAETEDTLWTIVRGSPNSAWAHQTLFDVYRTRRDTDNMRALLNSLQTNDPTVPRYRYDWSLLSMLQSPRAAWTDEKQAMETLYQSDPGNAYYVTGYAFALTLAERDDEAIELVKKLSATEQALPERAPYLAFIYSRNYQTEKVNELASKAAGFTNYLPEETELLKQARDYVR